MLAALGCGPHRTKEAARRRSVSRRAACDTHKRPKEPRFRIVRPIRESVESFGCPWPLRAETTLGQGRLAAKNLIHEFGE